MNHLMRRQKLLLILLLLTGLLLILHHGQYNSGTKGPRGPGNLTILLWYWPFGRTLSLEGDVCWERYEIPGCRLGDNRSLYLGADVVVFHHYELKLGLQRLPLHLARPPSQKWLWLSLEAPQSNGNLAAYAGLFNWTMSYRRDADITMPYGKLVPKEEDRPELEAGLEPEDSIIPTHAINKSSLACWVVSNYQLQHKRTQVYQELRKTIKVEVYGQAVKRPLDDRALLSVISHSYFYLAFENALSPDYITEKLWRNAFLAGAVPVVLGAPRLHYEAVAPPHSFIHVDDFNSTEALGTFLQELAKDGERYEAYFAWRQSYRVKRYSDWRERLCNICPIYASLPSHKVYHDLGAWARSTPETHTGHLPDI